MTQSKHIVAYKTIDKEVYCVACTLEANGGELHPTDVPMYDGTCVDDPVNCTQCRKEIDEFNVMDADQEDYSATVNTSYFSDVLRDLGKG